MKTTHYVQRNKKWDKLNYSYICVNGFLRQSALIQTFRLSIIME